MKHILIADDTIQISTILNDYAIESGYQTTVVHDGLAVLDVLNNKSVDLILLDVMMPKMDGFEVCRKVRETSMVPIIMITARGEDFEKIMGLEIGADDYIVKPFSAGEVMARVKALLRRVDTSPDETTLMYDNLKVSISLFQVFINQEEVALTKKEIELLYVLVKNKGKVFTRENLLDSVWGYDYFGDSRTVDSHIKRLRAKLDQYEHPKWQIKTVWGVGYKFEGISHEV